VTGTVFLKLVNAAGERQPVAIRLQGVRGVLPLARATVLASASPQDTNTLADPTHVAPRTTIVTGVRPSFEYSLPPYSITVLEIRTR